MDMGELISLWPKRKRPLIRQVWPVGLILMPRGLSGWAAVFTESILIIFHFYPHPSFQSCIKKLLGYAVLWSPDEHVKVKDHVFSQKLFGKSLSPKDCTILWQNCLSVTFHEEYWSLYPPQCTQTATSPWWGDKKGCRLFHSSLDPIQRKLPVCNTWQMFSLIPWGTGRWLPRSCRCLVMLSVTPLSSNFNMTI